MPAWHQRLSRLFRQARCDQKPAAGNNCIFRYGHHRIRYMQSLFDGVTQMISSISGAHCSQRSIESTPPRRSLSGANTDRATEGAGNRPRHQRSRLYPGRRFWQFVDDEFAGGE